MRLRLDLQIAVDEAGRELFGGGVEDEGTAAFEAIGKGAALVEQALGDDLLVGGATDAEYVEIEGFKKGEPR